jgi:hypothetical protein
VLVALPSASRSALGIPSLTTGKHAVSSTSSVVSPVMGDSCHAAAEHEHFSTENLTGAENEKPHIVGAHALRGEVLTISSMAPSRDPNR